MVVSTRRGEERREEGVDSKVGRLAGWLVAVVCICDHHRLFDPDSLLPCFSAPFASFASRRWMNDEHSPTPMSTPTPTPTPTPANLPSFPLSLRPSRLMSDREEIDRLPQIQFQFHFRFKSSARHSTAQRTVAFQSVAWRCVTPVQVTKA